MKKNLAFLFALLMLALAGCGGNPGSAASNPPAGSDSPTQATEPAKQGGDHVVDYKLDIPDGFDPTEQEGLTACWYAADGSNINLNVSEKNSATDLGFKAITAQMLSTTLVSEMEKVYGSKPTITDRYFTQNDVSGLEAYQYSYDLKLDDMEMTQIIVSINADKTYTFTYTTSDPAMVETFEASSKNIQLILE